MTCKHCCYSCGKKGDDMTIDTMRNAIKTLGGGQIAIGGGEPTLHPLFWQILGESIAASEFVWMATNGSNTEISLALANMAKKGVIGCALSQDDYHDEIDYDVIKAFTKDAKTVYGSRENDAREIRNVTGKVIKAGRASKNKIYDVAKDCCCEDILVNPNGDIRPCGCLNSPIFGNVNTEIKIPADWNYGECFKSESNKGLTNGR